MTEGVSKAIDKIKGDAIEGENRLTVSKLKREGQYEKTDLRESANEGDELISEENGVPVLDPEMSPAGTGFTLNDVTQVLRQKYLALLAGALVGLALAAIVLNTIPPIYAVSARVVLTRQDPGELANTDSGSSTFIATQAEVMSSLGVVEKAVATLPRPDHLKPDADAVANAHAAIHASAISNTRVIALGYLGPDGEYGAALLRAMVDAYANELREATRSGQIKALDTKAAELDMLLAKIADQEAQIMELRASNNIIGTADEAAAAQADQLRGLNEELTKVRSRRMELENRLATGGIVSQNNNDRTRFSLQEDLRLAEAELARVSRTLTAEHPTVMAARNNVEILREQLAASDKVTLVDQVAEAVRYEAELTAQISQVRKQLDKSESHRRTENELLAELAQNRSLAETWRQELSELRMGAQLTEEGNVGVTARFTDLPVAPERPVWPQPKLMMPAGLVLGLIGGFIFGLVSLLRGRKALTEVSNP